MRILIGRLITDIYRKRAGDGDHLDIFILTAYPLEIGTIVQVRSIGMIELIDRGEEDNKILAVPVNDKTHKKYQTVEDLPEDMITEFRTFFRNLAEEKHKELQIVAFHGKERAIQELLEHKL